MTLKEQSLAVTTIYAELAQLCLDAEAAGTDPASYDAVGAITPAAKTIRGRIYWYAQYTDIEGRQRQSYIGPDNEVTQNALTALQDLSAREEMQRRRDMVKMLRSAGFSTLNHLASGAILALDRTGIFKAGVTLVGTPAYQAILNRFGFSENPPIQTNDIDFSVRHFELAIPEQVDIANAMREWNPKSFQVPSFNLKDGSSSFKIRGKDFHIDFLTNGASNETGKSAQLPNLGFNAQKLPFLDYLVDSAEKTLLLSTYGVVIPVPNAARFAFHKCAVAADRPTIFDAKREKDKHQARTLFGILLERDPYEIISAYKAIASAQEGGLLLVKIVKTLNEKSMSGYLQRIEDVLQTKLATSHTDVPSAW